MYGGVCNLNTNSYRKFRMDLCGLILGVNRRRLLFSIIFIVVWDFWDIVG